MTLIEVRGIPGAQLPFGFTGSDYEPKQDEIRLTKQALRIFSLMADGRWRTLGGIESSTGDPQASISAQLRHFRKQKFGAHTIEKESLSGGLWRYRLIVNRKVQLYLCDGVYYEAD